MGLFDFKGVLPSIGINGELPKLDDIAKGITDAAKVIKDVATVAVDTYKHIEGAFNGASGKAKEPAAKTEYAPPASSSACTGYSAQASTASSTPTGPTQIFNLDTDDIVFNPSGSAYLDAQRGHFDFENTPPKGAHGGRKEYIQMLKNELLGDPSFRKAFEKQHGVIIDVEATMKYGSGGKLVVRKCQPGSTEPTQPTNPTNPTNPPPQTGTQPVTGNKGPLDPNIHPFLDALKVLDANFNVYDTAVGLKDHFLTKDNLKAIVDNPNASATLKNAAKFLLDHPEYYNYLELAAGVGGKDGIVGWGDVKAAIKTTEDVIKQFSTTSGSAKGTDSGFQIPDWVSDWMKNNPAKNKPSDKKKDTDNTIPAKDICKGSSGTLEGKIEAVMNSILDSTDAELGVLFDKLGAAEAAELKYAGDETPDGKKKAMKASHDRQRLMFQIQQVMEKRNQMFQLLSNMSAKFNEMAKVAINNMKGA